MVDIHMTDILRALCTLGISEQWTLVGNPKSIKGSANTEN